jgi:hypothetical protein
MHRVIFFCAIMFAGTASFTPPALPKAAYAAPQRDYLSDYFKPESNVKYIEVFHIDSGTMTLIPWRFSDLMSVDRADSYVRLSLVSDIAGAFDSLRSTYLTKTDCTEPDLRWVLAVTYTDNSKQAVGFGQFYSCISLLSGERFAATPPLLTYLSRTFPFMR